MSMKRKAEENAVITSLTKKNSREQESRERDMNEVVGGDGKRGPMVQEGGKRQTWRTEGKNMEERSTGRESTGHADADVDPAEEEEIQKLRLEPPFCEWLLPDEQRTSSPYLFFPPNMLRFCSQLFVPLSYVHVLT